MKRMMALVLALALMLAAAAGCSGGTSGTDTTAATTQGGSQTTTNAATTQTAAPVENDRVLRRASVESFTTCDPHYAARSPDVLIAQHTYESFYFVSRAGEMLPALATGHEISDDGLTYTFHLKQGVQFQTGGEMTTRDVLFSFDRAKESPNLYTQTMFIESYEAPDDYTFVITLSAVTPAFIFEVNDVYIMSETAMEGIEPSFAADLSGGTGPYMLTGWKPDERIIFTRFEGYHGNMPTIETIEMPVLGDYNTSLLAFESGELDLTVMPAEDIERISGGGKYGVLMDDAGNTVYMVLNCDKEPFTDVRVRQAFNYAVNREDIIYAAEDGYGAPAYTLGSPNYLFGVPGAGEIFTYEYNPDRARELLAEAGYEGGLTLPEAITTMAIPTFSTPTEVVQAQLAEVGVAGEIEIADSAVYVGDIMAGNFLMSAMAITVYVDASSIARAYVTAAIDGDLNLGRYRNSEVDRLLEAANSTVNQNDRLGYFREAFDIASQEAAYLPLYWPETGYAYDLGLTFDLDWPMWTWSWK